MSNLREDKLQQHQELSYDIQSIVQALFDKKIIIISVTLIFSLCAVVYSLSLPNTYKSNALLKVASEDSSSNSSLLSQYSGVASIAGISLPSASSDSKSNMAIAILKSRSFLAHLRKIDESIAPALIAAKAYDPISKKIIYDENSYNSQSKKWVRKPNYPFKTIPSDLELYEQYSKQVFSAEIEKESGYIKLSVEHISPTFTESFLRQIINELNNISRLDDMNSSNNALKYLYSEASRTSIASIDFSISKLIESQLQKQMMAQISEEYLLKIIDKPFLPELKSGPNRKAICIMAFLAGIILSSLYSIAIFIYKKENPNKYN